MRTRESYGARWTGNGCERACSCNRYDEIETQGDDMNWTGVMPAMTTCFDQDFKVDHGFIGKHANWLLDNGCTGLVLLGSLCWSPNSSN